MRGGEWRLVADWERLLIMIPCLSLIYLYIDVQWCSDPIGALIIIVWERRECWMLVYWLCWAERDHQAQTNGDYLTLVSPSYYEYSSLSGELQRLRTNTFYPKKFGRMVRERMWCLDGNEITDTVQRGNTTLPPHCLSRADGKTSVCEEPFQKKRLNVRFECFVWLLCRKHGKT